MFFGSVAQEIAATAPWALVLLILLVLLIRALFGLLGLRFGLQDVPPAERPAVIRALMEYFASLFRWRK